MNATNKKIALFAHESQIPELLDWAKFNRDLLAQHEVYTTPGLVDLLIKELGITVLRFENGSATDLPYLEPNAAPLGFDLLIFFWRYAEPLPNDPDIHALMQVARSGNIPIAANRSAADIMFPAHLISSE